MYSRTINPPPADIIVNGMPCFGSFDGPFKELDIRGVRRPFGDLPFPVFMTNMRIRGYVSFFFLFDEYIGIIEICDAKIFGFCEVTFWNQKTGQKLAYRRIAGPFRIKLPHAMQNAVCACRSQKRYIRIVWDIVEKRINVIFTLQGDEIRPPIKAEFALDWTDKCAAQISSVIPIDIKRRCSASWQVAGPLSGNFSLNNAENRVFQGLSIFDIRRAYSKLRTKSGRITGLGTIDGRQVFFRLFSPSSPDEYRYNENVLFVDGKVWPMPPIKITRPYGVNGVWVIQDTESMVDLIFTPVSDHKRKMSLFVVRTEYHTVYGTFEGFLLTGEGERILLKGFSGIGKKLFLRM